MSDGFTTQYAIRLPNGELFSNSSCTHGSFIFSGHQHDPEPVVFDRREQAEAVIAMLVKQAAVLGIVSWTGQIEQRTCSPFSVTDPSVGLADEIEKWAGQQGGEK